MARLSTFAEVAALAGDPARAGMLHALMDGRALTASELARVAGVTPQTASGHLARLATAGLLCVEKQGRHRYHRIASPAVAQMMENMMQVTSGLDPARPPLTVGPRDAASRAARTCYDHLAGRLGVALADALVAGATSSCQTTVVWLPMRGSNFSLPSVFVSTRLRPTTAGTRRASCAGLASTGASGARILPARSERPCARTVLQRTDTPRQWHARGHGHAERSAHPSRAVRRAVALVVGTKPLARFASSLPSSQ
jgi:DNA-binding transcriptional ArsR family regulator